jgi:hypothetical protein
MTWLYLTDSIEKEIRIHEKVKKQNKKNHHIYALNLQDVKKLEAAIKTQASNSSLVSTSLL